MAPHLGPGLIRGIDLIDPLLQEHSAAEVASGGAVGALTTLFLFQAFA